MDQLQNFADDRLLNGCIYCGGPAETRDHVPSKVFLEPPYPENLPVVGACLNCNQGFSKDEHYLACLLEAVLAGSANPEEIRRASIAESLRSSPALQARIEAARRPFDDRIEFAVEWERVKNVVLRLARGHAAFELSQPCRREPDCFWCSPLTALSPQVQEEFDGPHVQQMFGEVGSRGLQRMLIIETRLLSESGQECKAPLFMNNWMDVQNGSYRYLAIDDTDSIVIRIVIAEYLACEVAWHQ